MPSSLRANALLAVALAAAAAPAQHWAFVAPREAPPSAVGEPGWRRDPLDGYVQAALAAAGRRPAPPAGPLAPVSSTLFF